MTRPGLYIHVPFCEIKCGYCNFYSVTTLSHIPDYTKALLEELSLSKYNFSYFDTIYIGGGTPSVLSPTAFSEILQQARNTFMIAADAEITVEVNPADARLDFFTSLRQMGVNRLNIGIQSFDASILRFLDRRHTPQQAIQAVETARTAEFDNIGFDFIFGIPGQSASSWKAALTRALSFQPEHLSCYQLSLETGTPLGQRYEDGEFMLPGEDEQVDLFMMTSEILEDAGYLHYEVSNYARGETFRSRHNQKYWRHTPYLGVGPAAHSFSEDRRWWNHRSLKQYLFELGEGRLPVEDSERLTPVQQRLEACFLGLRTKEGIPFQLFAEQRSNHPADKERVLNDLVRAGLIVIEDDYLKPTRRGLAVADRLALML
jgi:oxygen-independent coproporphyrinogen III oxidase